VRATIDRRERCRGAGPTGPGRPSRCAAQRSGKSITLGECPRRRGGVEVQPAADTLQAPSERAPSVAYMSPRQRRRLAALTSEQIALLQAALSCWERSIADTSYDPQVGEWARTHRTETGASVSAIRKALGSSTWESDW
jgi:hypothetical protein